MDISIRSCERAIGIIASAWPNRCHEIANLILRHHPRVKGYSRYGLYLGPVAKGSPFYPRKVARHGWIERPRGGIIDPTRWVFESVDPYIFVCGADNPSVAEYDIAGDRFKISLFGVRPPPAYSGKQIVIKWPQSVKMLLYELFGRDDPCLAQVFWLANQPLGLLAEHAEAVYQAIIDAGKPGWIPIDNRHVIFNDQY